MSDANTTAHWARPADVGPVETRIAGEAAPSAQGSGVLSRRQFCASACQVASCAALATFVTGCGDSQTSPSTPASALPTVAGRFSNPVVQINAAGTALANIGGAALVESTAGVFLLARTSATGFTAVEAVCTHEGCTINGEAGDIYVCPCHGSRYDRDGRVVNGPAKASLRQYPTTFADDVVTIKL